MNNNIYQYIRAGILGCAVGGMLISCSLDQKPISDATELTEGVLTDTVAAVLKDKQAALDQRKNLYELLRNRQEHWSLDMLLIAEAHSDNAYAGTTGAEVVPYETNSIDASNSVLSRDWTRYLADVAQANVLINGLDELRAKNLVSDAECRQWQAEGKIFRALIMFDMARLWGSFPVITDIAKTITNDNVEEVYPTYYPPKKTTEECYQQVIKDLEEALPDAPEFSNTDRTLLTKTVAQAMLAKVYAERPVGILEVHYSTGNGNWETWMYGRQLDDYEYYFTWAKWITPSRDLIRDFTEEGDEIRFNESVVYYECTWNNYYPASHYPFMYKCRSSYQNRYKLRLADILLMEAEAYAHQGNAQQAAALVNQIRQRVNLKDIDVSGDMVEKVLHERRLELAFEGQRWFDLCRNGKVEQYMNAVYAKDAGRLAQKRTFDENSYLLPLPQTALDENINLEQNPGY